MTLDCTGDADVAFLAGAPTLKGREGDGKCQPVTLTLMLAGRAVRAVKGEALKAALM